MRKVLKNICEYVYVKGPQNICVPSSDWFSYYFIADNQETKSHEFNVAQCSFSQYIHEITLLEPYKLFAKLCLQVKKLEENQ